MSPAFAPRSDEDVLALVNAYPLAWVVPLEADAAATPLPLLAECSDDGRIVSLFGHLARGNPLVAGLQAAPRALLLFQGPQGYVAPRLVSNPTWGPTWNYAVARFHVRIEFVPDETDDALERLARHLEAGRADPWTVDRMGARYAPLRERIIAFRAHVERTHATFKLGQDEAPGTFDEIVGGHPDPELREWMLRMRGD
ncbi:FMN-binding negative transcriptional regulator [Luteimonas suaedae]|uniref:FMN-binding negative transcriptional regulator n=1 Tax=Luteimonas suaedae TaxID=2605430 RepID=UPI0011EE84CD|nr:FMN-binding negative transcriptional regulator [Luteimonas suaedae]